MPTEADPRLRLPPRRIGETGLWVPPVGIGTTPLGNLFRPMDDGEARATLDRALAAGMGLVDTAPVYGAGLAERRVGDAVRGRPGVTLSTKVGRLLAPVPEGGDDISGQLFRSALPFGAAFDYSHDGVLRSFEDSLQRLGLARVDQLLVHDIGRRTHGALHASRRAELVEGGGLRALRRLREEGTVASIGLGVNEVEICLDFMDQARFDAILLAGRYTLLEQGALDRFLPRCLAEGTSAIIGGLYNSGILATAAPAERPHYDYAPPPPAIMAHVAGLRAVCRDHGVDLGAAALQFVLAHPAVAAVIPGLGSVGEVDETVARAHAAIPADFWAELVAAGLIRRDAPVPGPPHDRS